jgi:hypothetical protein
MQYEVFFFSAPLVRIRASLCRVIFGLAVVYYCMLCCKCSVGGSRDYAGSLALCGLLYGIRLRHGLWLEGGELVVG